MTIAERDGRFERILAKRTPQRVTLALAMLTLSACVSAERTASTRAANDFQCASDKVTVSSIGGNSYRADGCGKTAVYNCVASAGDSKGVTAYTCVPEAAPQSTR